MKNTNGSLFNERGTALICQVYVLERKHAVLVGDYACRRRQPVTGQGRTARVEQGNPVVPLKLSAMGMPEQHRLAVVDRRGVVQPLEAAFYAEGVTVSKEEAMTADLCDERKLQPVVPIAVALYAVNFGGAGGGSAQKFPFAVAQKKRCVKGFRLPKCGFFCVCTAVAVRQNENFHLITP